MMNLEGPIKAAPMASKQRERDAATTMSDFRSPAPPPADAPPCGVLLVNLGTPEAPTAAALKPYLAQFLSDPRVVELPRWRWWPILHGIILNTRPAKSAALYQAVWGEDGSPLLAISRRQSQALAQALGRQTGATIPVVLGMRYGAPSIAQGLQALDAMGCERILIVPMFPQYSAATTGSAFDAVMAELTTWRRMPELRWIRDYHDDPHHVATLAAHIQARWANADKPDHLLLSFHGMPQRYADAGDPYPEQCQSTARLLAQTLGLETGRWSLAYQSRFGKEPWLTPYTDEALSTLAQQGVKRVDVVCPGFAADCLETLEEVAVGYHEHFKAAGGEMLRYIDALNDTPEHIEALTRLSLNHLGGWIKIP